MPQLSANGIELAYECFGARSSRPLILIRGLATQMIHWDPRFCEQLAELISQFAKPSFDCLLFTLELCMPGTRWFGSLPGKASGTARWPALVSRLCSRRGHSRQCGLLSEN